MATGQFIELLDQILAIKPKRKRPGNRPSAQRTVLERIKWPALVVDEAVQPVETSVRRTLHWLASLSHHSNNP